MNDAPRHLPVLGTTVWQELGLTPGASVLDCTLGLGGHARTFLDHIGPDGSLIALDADADNILLARQAIGDDDRVHVIHANFRELPACLPDAIPMFDAIFADLGVSSPHLDDEARGFTFRTDAPLDMRYDRSTGATAADLLMAAPERELLRIFRVYGELPRSHILVRNILKTRALQPITRSHELSSIVEKSYGYTAKTRMPQVFQALRIAVNDELGALEHLVAVAPKLLRENGRFGVLTYHSLEDRIVKHAFRSLTTPIKDELTGQIKMSAPYAALTKRPLLPTDEEISRNPRARSAKFRIIARTSAVS